MVGRKTLWLCNPLTSLLALVVLRITLHQVSGRARALLPLHLVTGAIGAFHEGVDIADDYGTPIVATAAGVVTFAGYTDGGYGNLVEIDHGNGFVTRYGHNSAVLVTVGMSVKQGQTIALMGSTGKSTGAHVHYEVRLNGSPTDPMIFLPISN